MTDPQPTLADVRTFLFDLDGTLRKANPTSQEAILAYAYDLGYEVTEYGRREAILWSHSFWAKRTRAKPIDDLQAFWERYIRLFLEKLRPGGVTVDSAVEEITRRFQRQFHPEPELVKGAKELLWSLRSERYTVGIVSNAPGPLTGEAIALGIIEHVNFTVAAGQVDSWKPDSGIFKHALEMAGDAPSEAVYIGDNYFADVVGAKAAGLKAVLVDDHNIYQDRKEECLVITHLSDLSKHIALNNGESS